MVRSKTYKPILLMHTNIISMVRDTLFVSFWMNRDMHAMVRHMNWKLILQSPVCFKDNLDKDIRKAKVPRSPITEDTPRQNPILYM